MSSSSTVIGKGDYNEEEKVLARYRLLGSSGLRVSPICLGTMNFGQAKGWEWSGHCSKEEAFGIFDAYVAHGGNFIDTANRYHDGNSEIWLGEWMKARGNREELIIATKYSAPTKKGSINSAGNHKKNMRASIQASLKRLQTTYVDIFYVHFWDFTTPIEELLRSLNDLVTAGLILHFAISDAPAWMVARANTIAELRGWNGFICYQGRYSLVDRDLERDIFPMCEELKISVVPWGSIGQGKLSGKYKRGHQPSKEDAPRQVRMTERDYNIVEAVEEIATELNVSCVQVALAWTLLRNSTVSVLIGCRSIEQLNDNLGCLKVKLTEKHLKKLAQVSATDPGFPHNFISSSYQSSPWIKEAGVIV